MMTEPAHVPIRILRFATVAERTGETKSQIYAKMSREEFPKPVKLSPRCVGWIEAEIDLYLKQKIARRDAEIVAKVAHRQRLAARRARAGSASGRDN
jgi:prophage regulatory protein